MANIETINEQYKETVSIICFNVIVYFESK